MRRLTASLLAFTLAAGSARAQEANNASGALLGADLLVTALSAKGKERIEFRGAKSFKEEELFEAVGEEVRDFAEHGLTPARADDTAYYLGAFYRKKGFSKATVDYEIHGEKLVLKVNEGPRSLLRGVTFTGQHAVTEAQLWEYFLGATQERLAKDPDLFPYNENDLAGGVDRVRGLYISEGYLDAVVELGKVDVSDNGTSARVTVNIQEKQRYTFGVVRFAGKVLYDQATLTKAMIEPVDGPFSSAKATNAQRNLQSYYKAHGYYQAQVAVAADPTKADHGRVPVRFDIEPGPIFHFGAATVKGTQRLRADFLPKRFAHLQGQVYDPAKLDETFREMLGTGLFNNLRIAPTPIANNELRLDLTVEEAKAREIGATIGAGSYEGVSLGVRLADRDLFGRGRPASLSLDYSQRGFNGELAYNDPWLFDTRFSLRSKIYSAAREEDGYDKNTIGTRFDLGRQLLPHLELAAFVDVQKAKLSSNGIDEILLGPTDYLLSSVGLTTTIDYRDDKINPSRGLIATAAIDFSTLDGDPAFTRYTARFSYYLPLGKLLFAVGARTWLIEPIKEREDIPIDVRFFNGGGTTVRSFAERDLGPKSKSGDPLGGEFATVFNAELTFPITGGLQGAVFVDAGNLTTSDDIGVNDMRYALGLGLRYKLPIGPLRLDYGVNPSPRADEDRGAFHFSFGFAF